MTLAALCFPGELETRPGTAVSLGATPGSALRLRPRSPALHPWALSPGQRADSTLVLPWESFLSLELGGGQRAAWRGYATRAQGPRAVQPPRQFGVSSARAGPATGRRGPGAMPHAVFCVGHFAGALISDLRPRFPV